MEILQNLLKVPQPIRVELEFEPRSPKSESPHFIYLPTLKHLLPKNKDVRVVHFSQGCAMLARNNQVLTNYRGPRGESYHLHQKDRRSWVCGG